MDWEIEEQDKSWAEAFRNDCRAQALQSPEFWSAQRAAIRSRIAGHNRMTSLRIALASAAALCVIASGLLFTAHRAQPAPVSQGISDQQLLSDIDETISDPLPDALEPVQLISQDMDRSLQAQFSSGKKR